MRGSDDTRSDALGAPGLDHEVADAGRDPHEATLLDLELLGVCRVNPQRVPVTDLVEPLGVSRTRMDQGRNAEGREQDAFRTRHVEVFPVHMARNPFRRGVFGPAPFLEGGGEQFELLRRRREALLRLTVDLDRRRPVAERGELQVGEGRQVAIPRTRGAGLAVHAIGVDLATGKGIGRDRALVGLVRIRRHGERRAVAHVFERGLPHLGGRFGEAGDLVLEHLAVVLVDAEGLLGVVGRLEPLADAERTVGIDLPGEIDPELVLLPDLTRVVLERTSAFGQVTAGLDLGETAEGGLAEAHPATGMGLI